ncbi:MAG: DDE superfamily endonuclease-domain-containing protein [Benniella sp.]|nr:MAG: DDE superfamily endonuclease-domain-containing protein [Benniella sp.]
MPRTKYNKIDTILRQKVITSIYDELKTFSETAKRFMLPESTIRCIAKAFDEEGRVDTKPRGGNRFPILTKEHIEWLSSQVEAHPGITYESLTQQLNQHFNIQPPVSRSAVTRAVREQAGYTFKLMRFDPEDYNSDTRRADRVTWTRDFMKIGTSMTDVVFIDEAGFNLRLTRRVGRVPRGERAVMVPPTQRGENMCLVVTVGKEGVIASHVELGAFHAESYLQFITTHLLPALHEPRTIVMDNVPFQKSKDVQDAIENAGHRCLRLPPYTPHLNAAEWVFSSIKGHVRKQELKNQKTLTGHINDAIKHITSEMCRGWICEVERNFLKASRGEPLVNLVVDHRKTSMMQQ